jgi:TonB family protein
MYLDLHERPRNSPESRELTLLTELEPRHRVFVRNLGDLVLFREAPPVETTARPAAFWPDVFVDTRIGRRSLLQSGLWHVLLVVAIYGLTKAWTPDVTLLSPLHNAQITYYNVSEYLPPVDSGSPPAPVPKKGEPAYAKQKVISLPPNADNSRQTIVDPSTDKILRTPKPMPNIVAWSNPAPAVPLEALAHSRVSLPAPDLSVIAPAVNVTSRDLAKLKANLPTPEAVGPIAEVGPRDIARMNLPKMPSQGAVEPIADVRVQRKLGDLNIAAGIPTVAEPKLPVAEQRSSGAGGSGGASQQAAAPAAPTIPGGGVQQAAGRLIALGLDPVAPKGPIDMPGGNRRGVFAAGPEGKPGAPGTPDIAGGGNGAGGHGSGDAGAGTGGPADIPAGLTVASNMPPALGAVVASAAPPPLPSPSPSARTTTTLPKILPTIPTRVGDILKQASPAASPQPGGPLEHEVFGPKRFYTMSLNMPNLTSGAGTWIIRFAELHDTPDKADITAPVAMTKVDPAYPPELMRDNVEGTVTLYAVIRSDGTVGEVRVLRGLEERLDTNACTALARWHFQPGTKHGSAIDLEAVVQIPFRVKRITF